MISRGIILDSGNKYEVVKTDMFYNFGSNKYVDVTSTEPLRFYNSAKYERSFSGKVKETFIHSKYFNSTFKHLYCNDVVTARLALNS